MRSEDYPLGLAFSEACCRLVRFFDGGISAGNAVAESSSFPEDEQEHDTGEESAYMREPCDTLCRVGTAGEAREAIEELKQDVDAKKEICGDLHKIEEKENGYQRENTSPRKKQKVGAQHTGYRPARAYHGYRGVRMCENMSHGRRHPAYEVEEQEFDMAEAILNVVSEYP